jgi:hypothetical protein
MDPLEKFKTDFVRARSEAYQPGEKPGEKPRPKRKQNTQAQKPTAAQNNLREFGDALPVTSPTTPTPIRRISMHRRW